MVSSSGETCHPCTSHYLVQAYGGIILITRPTFMDISIYFKTTPHSSFHHLHTHTHTLSTHTHTQIIYIYLHIIMHVSTRTCYIHHKRGVTEVWHMAHFWCLMVDVPCLDHLWDDQKDCLDVGQVRCFHEETPRKMHHCMLLELSW